MTKYSGSGTCFIDKAPQSITYDLIFLIFFCKFTIGYIPINEEQGGHTLLTIQKFHHIFVIRWPNNAIDEIEIKYLICLKIRKHLIQTLADTVYHIIDCDGSRQIRIGSFVLGDQHKGFVLSSLDNDAL